MKPTFFFLITILLTACSHNDSVEQDKNWDVTPEPAPVVIEQPKAQTTTTSPVATFYNPDKTKTYWISKLEESSFHTIVQDSVEVEVNDGIVWNSGCFKATLVGDRVYFPNQYGLEHYMLKTAVVTDPRESAWWFDVLNNLPEYKVRNLQHAVAIMACANDTSTFYQNIVTKIVAEIELLNLAGRPLNEVTGQDIEILLWRYTDIIESESPRSVEEVRSWLNKENVDPE